MPDARPGRLGVVSWTSRDQDLQRLKRGLENDYYGLLLNKLQFCESIFREFTAWSDVVEFMHTGSSRKPEKNDILKAILLHHSEDRNPRWRTILLVIFWPALASIHWQKRHWDPDPDERWVNITWAFIQTICYIDLNRRPDRLVQKVFNDTVHRLYDEYSHQWKLMKNEVPTNPTEIEKIKELAKGVKDICFAEVELRIDSESEIKKLQRYLRKDIISEADFFLIIGTRIYGKSIAECAEEVGLDYQTAKKRRQRAEAKIRGREKKS